MVATLVVMSSVARAQSYGLDTRPALGPFLNGVMPPQAQSASGWQTAVAFPHLTFDDPISITPEPRSSRIYVCGREGPIYFFTNDQATTTKTLFLDLTLQTQGNDDCGVLGFAFHPQYGVPGSPNRGYVYIWYQYSPSPNANPAENTLSYNRLSRFTVPDGSLTADPKSEVVLINQFDRDLWHNGGGLLFGPDGYLYLSLGDEGSDNNVLGDAQRIDLGLFSGVIRIDVDMNPATSHPIRRQPQSAGTPPTGWPGTYSGNYYIPNDNPWQNTNGAVLEEFYAIGFRSPHRMTLDPPTGNIWLTDVGQNTVEEVDLIQKGGNYQWAYMEGNIPGYNPKPTPLIGVDKPPIYTYVHANGDSCIIGGYVYHGVVNAAYLSGDYIFADFESGRIWSMSYDGADAPQVNYLCSLPGANITSFGLDQNGELYFGQLTQGSHLYQLVFTGNQGQAPPALLSQTGVFTNLLTLAPNSNLIPYAVNSPLWSDGALKSRWLAVPNNSGQKINFATNGFWSFPTGTVLIKNFQLPINQTNPSALKRLETRFMIHGTNGNWFGLTYKWRADNSDADLLPGSLNETNLITTATGVQTQVWYYPDRQDCQICHNQNAGQVLGVRTCQLNGNFTYPATGVTDNQLRTLNHLGMFNPALVETNIPTYPQSVSITNTSADLTLRVRSYLDGNCAQCHRPNGVTQTFFDARFDTPLTNQGIIGGAVGDSLGISGAQVIAPSSTNQSIMYLRMNSLDSIKMPPLAKNLVDTQAVATFAQWINTLQGPLPVPNLAGLTQAAASSTLTSTGLVVGTISSASSATAPAGLVLNQNPAAGTVVAPGSTVNLIVSSGSPPAGVAVDQVITVDGNGTVTTPPFGAWNPGELLVAFAGSDGPAFTQTLTVSGAGLNWSLVQRANTQLGDAEIWQATATMQSSNLTVSSTPSAGGYDQSLTVVAFTGAGGTGASAAAGGAIGAATVSLTTSNAASLIYGVGSDYDAPVARVLGTNQVMVHQWVDNVLGDTFWVQTGASPIPAAGTLVPVNVTAPVTDRWDIAAVEIMPAAVPPHIDTCIVTGPQLVFKGTGPAKAHWTCLMATNCAQPLNTWIPVATNLFDATGHFAMTNGFDPSVVAKFYRLRSP